MTRADDIEFLYGTVEGELVDAWRKISGMEMSNKQPLEKLYSVPGTRKNLTVETIDEVFNAVKTANPHLNGKTTPENEAHLKKLIKMLSDHEHDTDNSVLVGLYCDLMKIPAAKKALVTGDPRIYGEASHLLDALNAP